MGVFKLVISIQKRFIFIHIYKTAGSSVSKALKCYEPISVKFKKHIIAYPLSYVLKNLKLMDFEKDLSLNILNYKNLPIHATAIETRSKIGDNLFNKLFKFAFVRNPWDWQVSLYHYMLQNPNHHQHHKIKSLKNFEHYIQWRTKNIPRLQKDFLTDHAGNVLVDYIGKLETINKDIDYIASKLDIQVCLPHINRSQRRSFREYYTKQTFDLVYEYFYDDVKMFGYDP
jgi:Sulfotransferase family